jgi:hypothetical protein
MSQADETPCASDIVRRALPAFAALWKNRVADDVLRGGWRRLQAGITKALEAILASPQSSSGRRRRPIKRGYRLGITSGVHGWRSSCRAAGPCELKKAEARAAAMPGALRSSRAHAAAPPPTPCPHIRVTVVAARDLEKVIPDPILYTIRIKPVSGVEKPSSCDASCARSQPARSLTAITYANERVARFQHSECDRPEFRASPFLPIVAASGQGRLTLTSIAEHLAPSAGSR